MFLHVSSPYWPIVSTRFIELFYAVKDDKKNANVDIRPCTTAFEIMDIVTMCEIRSGKTKRETQSQYLMPYWSSAQIDTISRGRLCMTATSSRSRRQTTVLYKLWCCQLWSRDDDYDDCNDDYNEITSMMTMVMIILVMKTMIMIMMKKKRWKLWW